MGPPLIVSTQHFCLHDGPGIRSVLFFKGCPLRCGWCQNPETWAAGPELAYKQRLCIGCGACVERCPPGCLTAPGQRTPGSCRACFACVEACPSGALSRIGAPADLDALLRELRPEYAFYERSGGGVTFSGGEPTRFPRFCEDLARRLRQDSVHVTLETCGHYDPAAAAPLLAAVDLVLFDLKLVDPELHRAWCGGSNRAILDNLCALARRSRPSGAGPAVWPRIPVVPGITDLPENLLGWARILRGLGLRQVTLVPYHRLGTSKRQWLDLPPLTDRDPPSDAELEAARLRLASEGIASHDPGEEPWHLLGPYRSLE